MRILRVTATVVLAPTAQRHVRDAPPTLEPATDAVPGAGILEASRCLRASADELAATDGTDANAR